MSGRKKRVLTADETALWAQVTRHIAPMSGRKAISAPPESAHPASSESSPSTAAAAMTRALEPAPAGMAPPLSGPPPLVPLERRLRQRLARGHSPIDAVIDLHGLRQSEAHDALRRFLAGAQSQGARVVLVVTGKGGGAAREAGLFEERGVLRRTVPHWLRLPDLRSVVIGFEEAAGSHGGSGALYVRIRRAGLKR